MEHVTYKKCVMERLIGRMQQRQTTWIPENMAHVGSILRMRQANGLWDNAWEVKDIAMDPPETFQMAMQREWELVKF